MAAQITGVFDDKLRTKITDSKILVVGAGGIGCEILKNLVLSGFKDIEIVRKNYLPSFRWHAGGPITHKLIVSGFILD